MRLYNVKKNCLTKYKFITIEYEKFKPCGYINCIYCKNLNKSTSPIWWIEHQHFLTEEDLSDWINKVKEWSQIQIKVQKDYIFVEKKRGSTWQHHFIYVYKIKR